MNVVTKPTIYLAGPLNFDSKEDFSRAINWREKFAEDFKDDFKILNPLKKISGEKNISDEDRVLLYESHKVNNDVTVRDFSSKIIETDLEHVVNSDYIILHLPLKSNYEVCGTYGEATLAFYLGIPVIIVSDREIRDIPKWLIGCSTVILKSFGELYAYILK